MSQELARRIVRRILVLSATAAVIGLAAVTVQLAAQWRTDSAPLDTVPVSVSNVNAQLQAEVGRSAALSGQVDQVASQIAELRAAVGTASGAVTQSTTSAQTLKGQLSDAQTKLTAVQAQLQAAQQRLSQLNAAAARQAAANARAQVTGPSTTTSSSGAGDRNGD